MAAQDLTKARLLDAAGEEFANKGFELARVRAICERAGANLAAVNYHFGDKEQLYIQALREAHRCGLEPDDEAFEAAVAPAVRLRWFIHHFLGRVLAMNQPGGLAASADVARDDRADRVLGGPGPRGDPAAVRADQGP